MGLNGMHSIHIARMPLFALQEPGTKSLINLFIYNEARDVKNASIERAGKRLKKCLKAIINEKHNF